MGLDQWVNVKGEEEPIGCWRKHPDLHGWMEELWYRKRCASGEMPDHELDSIDKYYRGEATAEEAGIFNQVELRLTEDEILDCMEAIRNDQLPDTDGFFFGASAHTEDQRREDLDIMEKCLSAVRQGKEVVYCSWW